MTNKKDENYIYQLVAQNLKREREKHGYTQSKFANLCNYSEGFIMNIESKKYHQTFSLGTLWTFAQVLNIDIRNLFEPIIEEQENDKKTSKKTGNDSSKNKKEPIKKENNESKKD